MAAGPTLGALIPMSGLHGRCSAATLSEPDLIAVLEAGTRLAVICSMEVTLRLSPVLLLAPALLTGCELEPGVDCNLMYAPEGAAITFTANDWQEGEWTIELDGERCTVTLPGTDAGVSCEDGDEYKLFQMYLSSDGTAIDGGWLEGSTPDDLDVAIFHDGELVHEQTLQPAYDVDEPNGPGCGERRYADVEIALD